MLQRAGSVQHGPCPNNDGTMLEIIFQHETTCLSCYKEYEKVFKVLSYLILAFTLAYTHTHTRTHQQDP